MADTMQNDPGRRRFALLIKWLGITDEQRHRAAVTHFVRLGRDVVPLLVVEAIKPGKRSPHRVALLDVIQKIGGPLELDEMCGLQFLLRHRDLDVPPESGGGDHVFKPRWFA